MKLNQRVKVILVERKKIAHSLILFILCVFADV